ncbi:hypothetical protein BJ322DRAFT_754912 [Thelephora terrestris]|uniref:Uncharacterized protein n=1 Tax=Thelephora terrestris TaxID=56493 RepID=A0A9P6L7S0_9AGAM|nr:hypothetical protein BJ322DRAFT_754912 [Thelephora terrestris]
MSAPLPAAEPHSKNSHRDPLLIHAGKGYAIMYSIWGRFRDILQRGSPLVDVNPLLLSPLDRGYREEYINLLSIEPKIADLLADRELPDLVRDLEKGRNEFRNSQVHSISNQISSWGIGVPDDKHLRGFGNDICGRLLCPSTKDWGDPIARERLQTLQADVTIDNFPRFLWEGERVDPQDMNKGFLRGELLVKALLSILIGPAAARPGGQCSGAGGYADILNMQTLTVPSLAFGAAVTRFALSAETKCRWSFSKEDMPGFNYLGFYQKITLAVGKWRDEDQRSLLMWWNRMILSHLRGGPHATQLNGAPEPGSAAALMIQQATGAIAAPH